MSAGLAVGTFCGLLFGVGTGPKKDGAGQGSAIAAAPIDAGAPPAPPDAAPVVQAPPPDAAPEVKKAVLTFEVSPPNAEVTVDGVVAAGGTFEVALDASGSKKVTVVAKARGHRPVERELTVSKDTVVPLQLRKQRTGGGGGSAPTPQGPIIDL